MLKAIFILALAFPFLLLANPADMEEKAKKALGPFKKELKQELQAAFQKGGPVEAVDVCKVKAEKIGKRHETESISIGRSSHKLRNPRNKPEEWMKEILDGWKDTTAKKKADPKVVPLDANTQAYVEPIYVDGLCLQCHGQNLAPQVEKKIKKEYPEDEAKGFEPGDFRGIFWVKINQERS